MKLASPVNREPNSLDRFLSFARIIVSHVNWVNKLSQLLLWDAVNFLESPNNFRITLLNTYCSAHNRFTGPVPSPREKSVVSLHPHETGINVNAGRRETVPKMQRTIHVRVWKGHKKLFPLRVRINLEDTRLLPFFSPFLLDFLPFSKHKSHPPTFFRTTILAFSIAFVTFVTLVPPP